MDEQIVQELKDIADQASFETTLQAPKIRASLSREAFSLFSLVSGSSGNAYLLQCKGRYFLFDAGLSLKKLKEALHKLNLPSIALEAIFITHEHRDHLQGLLTIQKYFKTPVYTSPGTAAEILARFPKFNADVLVLIRDGQEVLWDQLSIRAHEVSHDAAEPLAFTARYEQEEILILTDTGKCPPCLYERYKVGPSLVVLEANYQDELLLTGPYSSSLKQRIRGDFGHLSNEQAAKIIEAFALRGSRKFILAHLSMQNNFPELANLTIRSYLKKHLPQLYNQLSIEIAPRFEPMGPIYCGDMMEERS